MANPVQLKAGASTTTTATVGTLALAFTGTVTSGNAVGIGFAFSSSTGTPTLTSVTDDKGNTYTIDQNVLDPFAGSNNVVAHCLNVTNAPQTVTVTVGNTVSASIVIGGCSYEVNGTTAVDVTSTGSHASSASALSIAFTTANANEFAIVVDSADVSTVTWTQNNGGTQDQTSNFMGSFVFHTSLALAGANSLNMTPSTAVHSGWVYLVFNSSVAPPPPTSYFLESTEYF